MKIKFLGFLAFLVILSTSTPSWAASYDPHLKYRTIDTKHFSIHYPEKLESIAKKTAVISEEVHDTLSPKYKWVPWGRTQMLLLDSSDTINDMASVLPYNWISLRVTQPESDTSLNTYDDWLRMVIIHEYTHIMSLDKYGGFWTPFRFVLGKLISPNGVDPAWITEGIATYEETINTGAGRGNASFSEMLLRTAILQNKFPAIDEAEGFNWRWPAATSRYIYGVKFLQYLSDKYGDDKVYEFIDGISKSPIMFGVNHQARRVFSEMEFETKKIHNRYVREKKTGAPKSKTFYTLWREWREGLKEKYYNEKAAIENKGVTEFSEVLGSKGTITSPAISPDGTTIVFSESTPFGPPLLKVVNVDGSDAKRLQKNVYATGIGFFPDGKSIVYSKGGSYKTYSFVSDLYKYNLENNKVERLTNGARAKDPDVSPDGKEIICVKQDEGTFNLALYNVEQKSTNEIPTGTPEFTEFSSPRFSPDGKKIAVAITKPGFIWDIYIYDRNGKELAVVTNDRAVDVDPMWSRDGKYLYFSSDRSGISNIYKYDLKNKKILQVTNVLTGVFKPVIAPDENIFAQYYNGNGYDLRVYNPTSQKLNFKPETLNVRLENLELKKQASDAEFKASELEAKSLSVESKKYNPYRGSFFIPRFVIPSFAYLDDAFLLAGYTGGADPLKWNSWIAGITYRTDAKYLGFSFNYEYSRFRPIIDIGAMGYAVDFGTYQSAIHTFHLYEKRLRAYGGVALPIKRHGVRLRYFYEDRQPKTALTQAEKDYFNFGKFAGFDFGYGYNDSKKYAASISKEGGRSIKIGSSLTNTALGTTDGNEQYVFAGDWREYIRLWGRHVLALKVAGGMTWGDDIRQGTFTLGGDLGEGMLAAGGNLFYFPLRGLPVASFARDRAMLMSAEYRLPLLSPGRGLGTMPLFLNDIHLALFADYGNAWDANQSPGKNFFGNFMLGVGSELRGDFILGHGLPITGRVGYGIIVVNRDRLGTLKDPILGDSVSNGILILQVGTSF